MHWLLTLFLLNALPWITVANSIIKDPPFRIGDSPSVVYEQPGNTVKLTCPLEGGNFTVYDWFKDGDKITEEIWTRFRVSGRVLKIKDLQKEDMGHYWCKAVNGFGSREFDMELIIYGEHEMGSNNLLPDSDLSVGPFIPKHPYSHIQRPVGSDVKLKCPQVMSGVVWYKDGKFLRDQRRPVLHLNKITLNDSGIYTCDSGSSNHTVYLSVKSPQMKFLPLAKPQLLGEDPVNTTVAKGNSVNFICRVRSEVPVTVSWLRKVEEDSISTNSNVILFNGNNYEVVTSHKTVEQLDGSYISKLVVSHADGASEGVYACAAVNTAGFSFREAKLTVEHNFFVNQTDFVSGGTVWTWKFLIALAPVALIAVVLLTAAFMLRARRGKAQLPPSAENETTTVHGLAKRQSHGRTPRSVRAQNSRDRQDALHSECVPTVHREYHAHTHQHVYEC